MPLTEIELDLSAADPPEAISTFLKEADLRCDEYFETNEQKKTPSYIPADYFMIYRAIKELQDRELLLGNKFCEWGSGMGIATCLASLMGFEAVGVEIEDALITRSRLLAKDFQIPATFLHNSYLPEGFDFLTTQGGNELAKPRVSNQHENAYEGVDWTLDEIDLFYVYPWPFDQEPTLELFDEIAAEGAYLLCYYGQDELCAYLKE